MPSRLYLCRAMKSSFSSRPVTVWVFTGVIMLLIQVILGGITRLTGSGLSITEWNIVTGALPPLDKTQWQDAFDRYRQTAQFHILNQDFNLSDFKYIFFWEWFHRFWARMVGVVFLTGFVLLVWKKKIRPEMIRPLIYLFVLGGLQGAIGWIMVVSGLTGDAIYVAPARLALHFVFALLLVSCTFWFGLQLYVPGNSLLSSDQPAARRQIRSIRRCTLAILFVLFFQLLFGALMAGHKAAAVAPTWPTLNGNWIPSGLFNKKPLWEDLAANKMTIQFIHRSLAYLLLVMVLVWSVMSFRLREAPAVFVKIRKFPLILIGAQITLGILSLLASPGIVARRWVSFDWLAQVHQITGLLFLLTMVGILYLVKDPSRHSVTV
jgi:cytochrome c oxidase assembly protein subunit 15